MEYLTDKAIDERIEKYRKGKLTIKVTNQKGEPWVGKEVLVEQTGHKFHFGVANFRINFEEESIYNREISSLFNFAILPFYWESFEAEEGKTDHNYLRKAAQWSIDRGLTPKAHPLCWHGQIPSWLNGKSPEEVMKRQLERIKREMDNFKDLIKHWDITNEIIMSPDWERDINPYAAMVAKYGRLETIKRTYGLAREIDSQAKLTLNDFDNTSAFSSLIEEVINEGIDFDIIGLQTHMYGSERDNLEYWEEFVTFKKSAEIWDTCERFSQFNKPIHFTELDISSGPLKTWTGQPWKENWNSTPQDELRQEHYLRETYRVMFSHPNVHNIVWWDFLDPGFMGAPIGLLRKDSTEKPALKTLKHLINTEWWTGRQLLYTNEEGEIEVNGFLGEYSLTSDNLEGVFAIENHGENSCQLMLR